MSNGRSALSLEGLTKDFQGQRALDDAHLELRKGEVHALLGQNGSGKSTLIKILAGYHQPEPGARALLHGEPFPLGSAVAARHRQIRFIHQDLGLINELDAVDNLALGARYAGRWWLSDRRERRRARQALDSYGIGVDVSAPLDTLTAAQRSMLAIARALASGLGTEGVLVLDEPTAALPEHEVRHLFGLIEQLRQRGITILYVTHRLSEVFEIADRLTVLRDGRTVSTRPVAELDHDALIELIIGRPLEAFYPAPPPTRHDVVLAVDGLTDERVDDVSLRVHRGEIVGVAGLVGSGYETLLQTVFGGRPRLAGSVAVDGRPVPPGSPAASVTAGLAFLAADRARLSGVLSWTLRENVTLPRIPGRGPVRWLSERREHRDVRPWLQRLQVVPEDPERVLGSLSGGNQQKVMLARWLRCGARAYLLEEPTNGVDVASKHAIYEALAATAKDGAGVLFSSSDVEELCAVCDRVAIMRDGRIGAVLEGAELTPETITAEALRADARPTDPEGADHGAQ